MVAAPEDDGSTPDDGAEVDDTESADGPAAAGSTSSGDDPPADGPPPDAPDSRSDVSPSSATTDARPRRRPFLAEYLGTGTERTLRLVLAVTVLAVLARLVLLGDRVQHFDEGRVAWWTLEFMRTDSFRYRYIIHGPFIQHLNTLLFSVLGTTDFATRLVPALVGGLLPASTLLFREHLRRSELVALALFLAANPLLLYYSRFSRSTMLVAGFAFVAFGFFVRAMDARDAGTGARIDRSDVAVDGGAPEAAGAPDAAAPTALTDRTLAGLLDLERTRSPALYVHVGVFFFALGFAAKENALVYLLCWIGAGVLVADRVLSTPGTSGFDRAESILVRFVRHLDYYLGHAVLALLVLGVVTFFFYAPRGAAAPDGVGLYAILGQPGQLPTLVDATVADVRAGLEYWFTGASEPGCNKETLVAGYACFLGRFLESMVFYAAPLTVLAVVGFLADRYTEGRPRALVMFTAFWGFASVLGYPLGTDIYGPWITLNALVPLAVPAAVGLALLYRWGVEAYRDDDGISLALVLVLLLVAGGATGYQGVTGVYVAPESGPNSLVQYAQPEGEWRPLLEEAAAVSAANPPGAADVLVHGSYYVDGATSAVRTPACIKWFNALPLPWYMEKDRMRVVCTNSTGSLDARESMPPVVIARASRAEELESRLGDDYRKTRVFIRQGAIPTVVYVDQSAPRADLRAPSRSGSHPRGADSAARPEAKAVPPGAVDART
ncbi:MAG: flippase activity-associated protein Agl23 [Haloglomus sp.]